MKTLFEIVLLNDIGLVFKSARMYEVSMPRYSTKWHTRVQKNYLRVVQLNQLC